jgi:hypothetical protein
MIQAIKSVLKKPFLSSSITLKRVVNTGIFENGKNRFFRIIHGLSLGSPQTRDTATDYIAGFIIKKADLAIFTVADSEGVLVSFTYKETPVVGGGGVTFKETHLVFQKIVTIRGGNDLDLESAAYTTDPNGGGAPDPLFHCPGPNCNA